MPYPHIIRLRGPWHYTPLARFNAGPLPPPGRVELPTDWGATLGDRFRGRVRYERSFNPPTNLDPHERVWLVVDGADARADLSLNGQVLGAAEGYALSAEWEITEIIGPHNALSIEVELPCAEGQEQREDSVLPGHRQGSAPATGGAIVLRPGRESLPGGLIGQVRLEIRSTAFVEDYSLWVAVETKGPTLYCSGRVRGDGEVGPLSLVVGALEREILYENVTIGKKFEYSVEAGEMPVWAPGEPCRLALVEIKLISGGAAVWQSQCETAAIAVESERQGLLKIGDRAITRPPYLVGFGSGDLELAVQKLRNQLPAAERGVVFSQIWPEPLYTRFDRAGIAVLQAMPLEWAEHVCPRLAHHSSISAWCLPPEAPQRSVAPSAPFYGRPWVSLG